MLRKCIFLPIYCNVFYVHSYSCYGSPPSIPSWYYQYKLPSSSLRDFLSGAVNFFLALLILFIVFLTLTSMKKKRNRQVACCIFFYRSHPVVLFQYNSILVYKHNNVYHKNDNYHFLVRQTDNCHFYDINYCVYRLTII